MIKTVLDRELAEPIKPREINKIEKYSIPAQVKSFIETDIFDSLDGFAYKTQGSRVLLGDILLGPIGRAGFQAGGYF